MAKKYLVVHPDTNKRFIASGSHKLTPNFTVEEFASRDGNEVVIIDECIIRKCQALRDMVGHSVSIGRGFTTISHNATIAGASVESKHLFGSAVDVSPSPRNRKKYTPHQWFKVVEFVFGWDAGLGEYSGHTHADYDKRRRWHG